jgi:outer membrane protein TolC
MTRLFLKLLFLVITVLVPLSGFSQGETEIRSFTVKEAQEFALENNLNVKNARLDVEHAEKVIWENTSIGFPQINSSVSYNNNLNLPTTLLPGEIVGRPGEDIEVQFGTQHNATAGINTTQMIFSGPFIVGLQASKIFKKSTEEQLVKTEYDTKELIAQNYYLALLAEETYSIIDSNVQNLEKTYYETKKMYESGFAEETDADQIRVNMISLQNSLKSAKSQIEVAYKMLKYQLGIDLNVEIVLSEKLNDIVSQVNLKATLADTFNVNEHIDFQLMQTAEKLAELQLKLKKTEYLPGINANFNNNWSALRNNFNFFNPEEKWYYSSVLGFTVSIPIFSSGKRRAMVSEKKIEYEQAMNNKKLTQDGLILQIQQSRSDFVTAYEKYLSQKENVEVSRKILERTRIKVREGMASSLDFTQINNQYLTTQSNYISAMFDLLNAKLKLDKAMNRL